MFKVDRHGLLYNGRCLRTPCRRFTEVRFPWIKEMNGSTDSSRNVSINRCERFKDYYLENTVSSLFSIALNLGSCPVIILINVLIIIVIKTRRRLQHTTGLLSRNRSGASVTAVIHRTRNLLSVATLAFALLLLLQTDIFCFSCSMY